MQPTWRNYADYFSMGLLLGLFTQAEVVCWADSLIEGSDRPEEWIIELSTSENRHPLDVIHLLDAVPGARNLDVSFKLLVAKLATLYPTILPKHSQLLGKLYQLTHDEISDDLKSYIYLIDCDLDFVEEGYGDWSVIQADYEEFLTVGNEYREWIG